MGLHAKRTEAVILATLVLASVALSLPAGEHEPTNYGPDTKSSFEPIEIAIKTLSGATIRVDIELSATTGRLKAKIQELTGVPREAQQLVYNRALLKDEDHLVERNLEAGSIVFMVLLSDRVKKADDIVAFRASAGDHRPANAPIFREAPANEDDADQSGVGASRTRIYSDARNWLFDAMLARDIADLFDPTIRLDLTTAECSKLRLASDDIDRKLRRGERVGGAFLELRAQGLIAAKFKPHRKGDLRAERHGIRLGGTWRREEPLIANINNYAPDNFADGEILRLFELAEKVRRQLASDARTGEGSLGLAKQREINEEVMRAYNQAVANIPLPRRDERPDERGLCAICMESFELEPSSKLACNHTLHTDCLLEWVRHDLKSDASDKRARCPYCRMEFRAPYEGLKCNAD